MNKKEATLLLNLLNAGDLDGIRAALVNQLKELDTKDMLGNKFLSGIKAAKKELKKAKTPEERKYIVEHYRRQKMLMRKEFHREQNRNYHMDLDRPTEMLAYLEYNKRVHMNGLKRNGTKMCIAVCGWKTGPLPFLRQKRFSKA